MNLFCHEELEVERRRRREDAIALRRLRRGAERPHEVGQVKLGLGLSERDRDWIVAGLIRLLLGRPLSHVPGRRNDPFMVL